MREGKSREKRAKENRAVWPGCLHLALEIVQYLIDFIAGKVAPPLLHGVHLFH